ncbi:hypothetical protein BV25DRAFT_405449 [Artomyces pyxidatus]|uniref:Uncharacterized protein n=1 Tax=Artomyces pyxidatus TaxID=48021 RepID=A0ACB8T601_9AGAM|nr:hypothetical protein BV25DRAFT_405449 [Artomyces pyxidatus]
MAFDLFIALCLAFLVPVAHGHGFVHFVANSGQNYTGWNPFVDPYAQPVPSRVVRKIPSDGPVADVSGPDIACNTGGETGTSVLADTPAGSGVTFQWVYWPSDHLGPVSTYMTSCNDDCSSFDASSAKWFKLDADGYDNGTFASQKLMDNNFQWTSTIPAALAPGQYLMRHEIIALHSTGDPQYYPSCTQVNVTGNGSGVPSDQYLVAIPGLYNGVQWPDIYNNFQGLTLPGPPVVELGQGSTASADPSSTAPSSTSASRTTASSASQTTAISSVPAASSTPLSSAPKSTGQCSLSRKRALGRRHSLPARFH